MKTLLNLATGLFLLAMSAYGQKNIDGRIYDAYTNTPVEGATITYSGLQPVKSNEQGLFTIPCQENKSISISHPSYETWEGKITACNELNIGLIPSVLNLNGVEITAQKPSGSKTLDQPQSISVLSRRELNRNTGLFLEESINLEPGINMEKRTMSGGQRITIRGYGNNTNFNGMGYKAYINGIPITDATGSTILDDIDFSTLGKVEVIKGPASTLYGSGIGGVLNMYTLKPEPKQTSISQEVIAGSYGLFRTNTRLESATEEASILLNYGHQEYDSYRVNSASKKDYVSFNGDFRTGDKQVISTYLSYNNSYEQLAGQLDSTQFYNRENVAEQKYVDNDGHVAIESFRAGITHRYEFSKHISNVTSGFLTGKTLNQTFAVGLNEENTFNLGGRTEFQFDFSVGSIGIEGVAGGEFQKTNGIYNSYAMFGGVLGDHRSDNAIATMQYNVFTKWDVILPKAIKLTVGASSNFLEYDIDDRLANVSNPNHADASGYKAFEPVITPRVALQKTFNKKISAYVSVSQGYSPPTTSDVVIPYTGSVNSNLRPERGTQYEIGTKGNLFNNKFSWQLAVFSLNVSDKLTSQAVADTSGTVLYSYSVNAGDQTNNGLELALSYTAVNNKTSIISYLRPFATFTYSDFTYNDFRSDNNNNASTQDYSGNTVIGVPPIMFNAGLDIASKYGFYLNSSFKYVDEMYITFDNEHSAPSYTLLSAKIGYKKELGDHFSIDVFAGGNNLTNSLYYNMVFINWEKGPQPAIYSPGAYTPTFFGGVNLKYTF